MMVPPATQLRVREARRQRQDQERNRRRFAVVAAFSIVAVVTGLLAAFGGSGGTASAGPAPASASRLLPGGPPQPEIIANTGALHIQLPVDQSRVTALGYQGGSEGSLALSPVGTQANQGLLRRLARAIFGSSSGGPRWYQLPGGEGPATSSVDVGAAPGTDVYSPVDGTVVAIEDVVLNGSTLGSQVDIQPTVAPSLVISVSHISVDSGLTVGSAVTSGSSRLGYILDFSHSEQQALARYTNDAGNHVAIEVHSAATLQAP
jgi:murein DD-endopeptidase MepM/ murein hydrolase activator NlpD